MIITEEKIIKYKRKEEVFVKLICGICRKETSHEDWSKNDFREAFEENITKVSLVENTAWPEGATGRKIEYHICLECFKKKLIPFLKSLDAEYTETKW